MADDVQALPPGTPDEVRDRVDTGADTPVPELDPTLGVPVAATAPPALPAAHPLVCLGDSLTMGFSSGAIARPHRSWPAQVAAAMGWPLDVPRLEPADGPGGLPVDLERLARELETSFGSALSWYEVGRAALRLRRHLDGIEDWWERGPGSAPVPVGTVPNVAVYGWDVRDLLSVTADGVAAKLAGSPPRDQLVNQITEHDQARATQRVLGGRGSATPVEVAEAYGAAGGIGTLAVVIGANNALTTVTKLRIDWSQDPGFDDPATKGRYSVWTPGHFRTEIGRLAAAVRRIDARRVVWATVPHVTIAPIARGVSTKVEPGSRYFPYYTRPWITDADFHRREDPHITAGGARAVDAAIDLFNEAIKEVVVAARRDGRDWLLFDMCALLDRLASKRYLTDPLSRPAWWGAGPGLGPYELPAPVRALDPIPDTRFLTVDHNGRRARGGLFSLDGVHPTHIGYAVVAHEMVTLLRGQGSSPEPGAPGAIDFADAVAEDRLVTDTPANVDDALGLLGFLDSVIDIPRWVLRLGRD